MKDFLTVEHGGVAFQATTEVLADLVAAGEFVSENPGEYGLILTTGGALHFNTLEEYRIIRDLVVLARRARAEHFTNFKGVKIDTVEIEPEPEVAEETSASESAKSLVSLEAPELFEVDPEPDEDEPVSIIDIPPPEDVQDILDEFLPEEESVLTLTPQELMNILVRRFSDEKNAEELARDNGDTNKVMMHVKNAQRLESGINWNRPRLAEQVG